MLTYEDALAQIYTELKVNTVEQVSIEDSMGRYLAQDVVADRDYPPFNRSAMDGYAIRSQDFVDDGLRSFNVAGVLLAGAVWADPVPDGVALKVMTGAPVPKQLDAVIKVEDTEQVGNRVVFNCLAVKSWQNIAKQGEDVAGGEVLIKSGTLIKASVVAALATVGCSEPRVWRMPKVALVATGNELVGTKAKLNAGQIRDTNSYVLAGLLQKHGVIASRFYVKDSGASLLEVFEKLNGYDIIISTGGVSKGDADHVPNILTAAGCRTVFHGVAIKPGKPILFGVFDDGPVVFGLPGNPVSCMVGFRLFVEAYLLRFMGGDSQAWLELPLGLAKKRRAKQDVFLPSTINRAAGSVLPKASNGSGDVTATLGTDGLAWLPSGDGLLDVGERVRFCFW